MARKGDDKAGTGIASGTTQNYVLSARLKAARERLRLSQTEIAQRAGVAMRTWQDYEAAKTAPGAAALTGLHEMGISLAWLLTGEEPMLRGDAAPLSAQGHPEGLAYIRRYDVRAAAGSGGGVAHNELPTGFIALQFEWIRRTLGRNPDDLLIIEASGDSMEPTISDNDVLLVDRTDRELKPGAVYVFRVEDIIQVKRISRQTNGDVALISDNGRYPPEVLPRKEADRLHIIGRVVWFGHRL